MLLLLMTTTLASLIVVPIMAFMDTKGSMVVTRQYCYRMFIEILRSTISHIKGGETIKQLYTVYHTFFIGENLDAGIFESLLVN
jgi:hypothetical protein